MAGFAFFADETEQGLFATRESMLLAFEIVKRECG
jgi:hypothetical protein